jgi:hypothetical protein
MREAAGDPAGRRPEYSSTRNNGTLQLGSPVLQRMPELQGKMRTGVWSNRKR